MINYMDKSFRGGSTVTELFKHGTSASRFFVENLETAEADVMTSSGQARSRIHKTGKVEQHGTTISRHSYFPWFQSQCKTLLGFSMGYMQDLYSSISVPFDIEPAAIQGASGPIASLQVAPTPMCMRIDLSLPNFFVYLRYC